MSRDKTTIETLKACRDWISISSTNHTEQMKLLADLDALIQRVESAGEPDIDALVDHGRILERYEHPSRQPLSEQNFRIYNESRRQIALISKALLLRLAGLEQGG